MVNANSDKNVYGPSTVVLFNGGVKSSVLVDLALQNSKQVYGLFICPNSCDSQQAVAANDISRFHTEKRNNFALCMIQMDYLRFRNFEIRTENRNGPLNHDFGFYHQAVISAVIMAWHMKAERVLLGLDTLDNMIPSTLNALYNLVLNMSEDRIKLEFPLVNKTFSEIIGIGYELHTPLHLTWSCYCNAKTRCSNCYGCITHEDSMKEIELARSGLSKPSKYDISCSGPAVYENL